MTVGQTYTVAREHIGDCWSRVMFVELPGEWFNTVHFKDAND